MSGNGNAAFENRLGVSAVLFALCILTLLVSLFGLFRTSGVAQTRAADLQIAWQTLMDDSVMGVEVVATDRLVYGVTKPVLAIHSAAKWSLAMGSLSLVFFVWHLASVRSVRRARNSLEIRRVRNDQAAIARLLDEMAPLASGDLAVRATALNGTAGALAGTFNHAVSELHRLAEVQLSTSRTLGELVNQSADLPKTLEQRCAQQIGHIHQSSSYLLGLSSSAAALSANSADTLVATSAIKNTSDAVAIALKVKKKQFDGMCRDAEMSFMLVQSMEQHASSIGEAIVLLRDLTQRADLLAVNATLRLSAMGSDVVSEDTRRLTEEMARLSNALNQAIDDIGAFTNSMRADTSEALTCMQQLHVTCGAQAADTRSQLGLLAQIQENSQSAQMHAVYMTEQAVVHVGLVKDLNEIMNLMISISERAGRDAQTNAVLMAGLKKIVNELRQSTSDFNLPESHLSIVEDRQQRRVSRQAAERAAING